MPVLYFKNDPYSYSQRYLNVKGHSIKRKLHCCCRHLLMSTRACCLSNIQE